MNAKKLFLLTFVLLLALLTLSACGDASQKSNFPTGKFVTPDSTLSGLYFRDDGTWYAFYYGEHLAEGTYSVKGDKYTEKTNTGGCSAPISFQYTFDGTYLKFQYIGDPAKDDCEGRRNAFNNTTYVLSK